MPLDVLNQIDDAMASIDGGGELARSLGDIESKARNSAESMNVLRGIVSGLTEGGRSLSESLDKVVFYFERFEKKSESASKSAFSLGDAYAAMGRRSAPSMRTMADALMKVDKIQERLAKGVRFSAIDNVSLLTKEIARLRREMKGMPGIPLAGRPSAGKFASGGEVPGSSTSGDKVPILVNSREYVLTQNQMRKIGRMISPRGLSPREVFSRASGRTDDRPLKGGRFASGGIVNSIGDTVRNNMSIGDADRSNLRALWKTMRQNEITMSDIASAGVPSSIRAVLNRLGEVPQWEEVLSRKYARARRSASAAPQHRQSGMFGGQISSLSGQMGIDSDISRNTTGATQSEASGRVREEKSLLAHMTRANSSNNSKMRERVQSILESHGAGNEADMASFMSSASSDDMRDLNEELESAIDSLSDMEREVSDLSGAWEHLDDEADEMIKKFSSWLGGTPTGLAAVAVGVTMVATAMVKVSDEVKSLIEDTAKLKRNFAVVGSSMSGLGSEIDLEGIRDELDLTMEKALELGDSFKLIGLHGMHDVSMVSEIASNLKNALGEVDTSKLAEAVQLIDSLPKKQVEFLLRGTGSLDDRANLIANLINDGNLDKSIDLMMSGAFGEMDGMVNVPEKDKALIKAVNRSNKFMEDIKVGIYDWLPESVGNSAVVASTAGKILFTTAGMIVPMAMGLRALLKLSSASGFGHIRVLNIGAGSLGNLSGLFKSVPWGKIAAGAGVGMATFLMGRIATSIIDNDVKNKRIKADEYRSKANSIESENRKKYGTSFDFSGDATRAEIEQKKLEGGAKWEETANSISKAATAIAAGALAIGVATGTFSAGVGLAIGAAVAGLALVVGKVAGAIGEAVNERSFDEMRAERGEAFVKSDGEFNYGLNKIFDESNKKYLDVLAKVGKNMEDNHRNLMRSMVAINRHLYDIQQIVSGRLTSFLRNQVAGSLGNIKSIGIMGGRNESYSSSVKSVMGNSTEILGIELDAISRRMEKIMSDKNLTGNDRMAAVAEVRKREVEIYERYNQAMLEVVGKFEEMPEVMLRSMQSGIRNAFSKYRADTMVGGTSMAAASAGANISDTLSSVAEKTEEFVRQMDAINENAERAEKAFEKAKENLRNVSEENGMTEEEATRTHNDLNRKMHDRLVESGTEDYAYMVEKFSGISNEMHPIIKKLGEGGELTEKDSEKIISASKQASGLLQSIESDEDLKRHFSKQELDSMKKLAEYDSDRYRINSDDDAETRKKKMTNLAKNVNAASGTNVLRFLTSMENARMSALTDEEREKLEKASKVLAAKLAVNGADSGRNAAERQRQIASEAIVESFRKDSEFLVGQLDGVFNSGSRKLSEAISEALRGSLDFDLLGRGKGTAAVERSVRADAALIDATRESLSSVRGKFGEMLSGNVSKMDETISRQREKDGLSEKVMAFQDLQRNASIAIADSLANPKDKDKAALAKRLQNELDMASQDEEVSKYLNSAEGKELSLQAGVITASAKKVFDLEMSLQAMLLRQVESIGAMITNSIKAADNQIRRISAEISGQKMEYDEMMGDYAGASAKGDAGIRETAESAWLDVRTAEEAYGKAVRAAEEARESDIASGMSSGDADNKYLLSVKKAESELYKVRIDSVKRVNDAILAAAKVQLNAVDRMKQGLEIDMDVANSLGLPFEYIIQLEQQRVLLAKETAAIEEKALNDMMEQGLQGPMLEEQKLKYAKAQAEVLKASFGAQRDAIDKMLAKAMGAFNQMGGIFGPNGPLMQARKYGQGYMTNESGMAVRSNSGMGLSGRNAYANMGGNAETPQAHAGFNPFAGRFSSGGRVPGGSTSGDKVPILVNSKEYVLTQEQMKKIGSLISSKGLSPDEVFSLASGSGSGVFASKGRFSPGRGSKRTSMGAGNILNTFKSLFEDGDNESHMFGSSGSGMTFRNGSDGFGGHVRGMDYMTVDYALGFDGSSKSDVEDDFDYSEAVASKSIAYPSRRGTGIGNGAGLSAVPPDMMAVKSDAKNPSRMTDSYAKADISHYSGKADAAASLSYDRMSKTEMADDENSRAMKKFANSINGTGKTNEQSDWEQLREKTKDEHDCLERILYWVKKIYNEMTKGRRAVSDSSAIKEAIRPSAGLSAVGGLISSGVQSVTEGKNALSNGVRAEDTIKKYSEPLGYGKSVADFSRKVMDFGKSLSDSGVMSRDEQRDFLKKARVSKRAMSAGEEARKGSREYFGYEERDGFLETAWGGLKDWIGEFGGLMTNDQKRSSSDFVAASAVESESKKMLFEEMKRKSDKSGRGISAPSLSISGKFTSAGVEGADYGMDSDLLAAYSNAGQRGYGEYSNGISPEMSSISPLNQRGQKDATKDALDMAKAVEREGGGARGGGGDSGGGRITVDVNIKCNSDMFKAEVKKAVTEIAPLIVQQGLTASSRR